MNQLAEQKKKRLEEE